jgi:hypothetical protein
MIASIRQHKMVLGYFSLLFTLVLAFLGINAIESAPKAHAAGTCLGYYSGDDHRIFWCNEASKRNPAAFTGFTGKYIITGQDNYCYWKRTFNGTRAQKQDYARNRAIQAYGPARGDAIAYTANMGICFA